jgi:hypothetical protein
VLVGVGRRNGVPYTDNGDNESPLVSVAGVKCLDGIRGGGNLDGVNEDNAGTGDVAKGAPVTRAAAAAAEEDDDDEEEDDGMMAIVGTYGIGCDGTTPAGSGANVTAAPLRGCLVGDDEEDDVDVPPRADF